MSACLHVRRDNTGFERFPIYTPSPFVLSDLKVNLSGAGALSSSTGLGMEFILDLRVNRWLFRGMPPIILICLCLQLIRKKLLLLCVGDTEGTGFAV